MNEEGRAGEAIGWAYRERLGGTWPRALALARLSRPLNAAMMAIGVSVGAILAGGGGFFVAPGVRGLIWAILAATAIGAGANAINDFFDRTIDRSNRPERPIPSGAISPRVAVVVWGVLSGAGVVIALAASWVHGLIALTAVALLFVYSSRLKRLPLSGNLVVAAVLGLAIVFGGLVPLQAGSGRLPPLIAGAAFAAVVTLARELVKDIEDLEGDAAHGARTLAVVAGPTMVSRIAAALMVMTTLALPIAPLAGLGPAIVAMGIPAAGLLLAAAWIALGCGGQDDATTSADAARSSMLLKGAMLIGMVALAVAAW